MANITVSTDINSLLTAATGTPSKDALGVLGAVVKGTGDIVNADISAAAAISDTKLSTIATVGKVSNSATTATSENTAFAIIARDANGSFYAGTSNLNSIKLADHTNSVLAEGNYAEDSLKRLRRHNNSTVGGLLVVPDIYSGTKEISLVGKGGSSAGSITLIDTIKVLGKTTPSEGDYIRIFGRTVFSYKTLPNVTPAGLGLAFTEDPTGDLGGFYWDFATGAGTYVYHDIRDWCIEWVFTSNNFALQSPSSIVTQQVTALATGAAVVKTGVPENIANITPASPVNNVISMPFSLIAIDQGTPFTSGAVRVSWSLQAKSFFA